MRHAAPTLDVRRAALEPHDVRLAQAQLGGVLDRDHPLVPSMNAESAFSSVVLPEPVPPLTRMLRRAANRGGELVVELIGERSQLDQLPRARTDRREAAYRQRRAVHRERRDDDVDARAVLQAGVDHRAELVHPSAERRQDPLDRVPQRLLRGEARHRRARSCRRARRRRGRGRSPSPPPPPGRRAAPPAGRVRPPRAGSARRGESRVAGSRIAASSSTSSPYRLGQRSRAPAPAAACARRRSIRRCRSSAASSSRCLRRTRSSTQG